MRRENSRVSPIHIIVVSAMIVSWGGVTALADDAGRIRPNEANPRYWQYKGEPILLLGGSSNDNLFQHTSPELDEELDRLVEHGGNYVRCTLSSRDRGDVYPFHREAATRQFNLGRWNDEYWKRLEYFLRATHDRQIIVQIEIWATYDFYTRPGHVYDGLTAWDRNPFNPANNGNYTEGESGLFATFQSYGHQLINPFFNTVLPLSRPLDFGIRNVVLGYQQDFVDKLLSISLGYDHVLYCIDNETQADPQWAIYWAQYIRKRAAERTTSIEVTEMWDPFDPTGGAVEGAEMQSQATHFFTRRSNVFVTLENPDLFSFVDISNHNAQVGETHFETGYHIRKRIQESGIPRPVNNVKIYGAGTGGWNGTGADGMERFWRNVFAGAASVRFHRPPSGLGRSDVAMSHIRSMRMLTDAMNVLVCEPRNDLLGERSPNEAYCLAEPGRQYAVYFPDGGAVRLDVSAARGSLQVRWLDINRSAWQEPQTVTDAGTLQLTTPGTGHWAALILRK